MSTAIGELAAGYAEARDEQSLERVRRAVLAADSYTPDLDLAADTAEHRAGGDHQAVVQAVRARMPGAFFSPGAHALLSAAYAMGGDATRARREEATARLAMAAILGSGDGTRERPWVVLRISDEYDVLRAQERTSRRQELLTRAGRALDRHTCGDGTQAWFDVSLLRRSA